MTEKDKWEETNFEEEAIPYVKEEYDEDEGMQEEQFFKKRDEKFARLKFRDPFQNRVPAQRIDIKKKVFKPRIQLNE